MSKISVKKIKVLIISHNPFSKIYNNGKTLEAIFEDFKKENISQLFFSDMDPDRSYCDKYLKISDLDLIKCCKNNHLSLSALDTSASVKSNKFSLKSIYSSFFQRYPLFRDLFWYLAFGRKKSNLLAWIDEVNPDFIFFMAGQYGFAHNIACTISDYKNLPLAVYFTDDYLINPVNRNVIDRINKFWINKFYIKTISKASICFTIGDKMSKVYTSYFSKQFYSIMNMVPISKNISTMKHEGFVISYFGGLHLLRWKQLCKLGSVISKLNVDFNYNITLNVYSKTPSEDILKCFLENNVSYMGFLNSDELNQKMQESDVLLHIESSDFYVKSLTKLSVSTKIPEYLASGRCILAFGPLDVASIELLSENDIAHVISDDLNDDQIYIALLTLLTDSSMRNEISKRGYEFAIANFAPENCRSNFNYMISSMFKY